MTLPNAFTSGWSVGMSAAQNLTPHARESESLTDGDGTKDGEDICPNLSRKTTPDDEDSDLSMAWSRWGGVKFTVATKMVRLPNSLGVQL